MSVGFIPARIFLSTPSARRATEDSHHPLSIHLYFYPRPPRGGRPGVKGGEAGTALFLSTPSARRATSAARDMGDSMEISIHALREEGDRHLCTHPKPSGYFYPRPPRGGRRQTEHYDQMDRIFLSTPSARRATLPAGRTGRPGGISIHALREEGDISCRMRRSVLSYFYPRPPRGGRPVPSSETTSVEDFYPRPPRGGRRFTGKAALEWKLFLSTPSARRATRFAVTAKRRKGFLSTPSARRATPHRRQDRDGQEISIHALREEGDSLAFEVKSDGALFLSTPSARRATCLCWTPAPSGKFLSTPSARRATRRDVRQTTALAISIHALREEGDLVVDDQLAVIHQFLSTPSARRATQGARETHLHQDQFLSTPSARRATKEQVIGDVSFEFLSTPSARRATFR